MIIICNCKIRTCGQSPPFGGILVILQRRGIDLDAMAGTGIHPYHAQWPPAQAPPLAAPTVAPPPHVHPHPSSMPINDEVLTLSLVPNNFAS